MSQANQSSPYDVFFLLGAGIGNVIQALYAVEHFVHRLNNDAASA